MHVQLQGEIGPFLDTVQQRQVSVVVLASCKYASMGNAGGQAQIEQQIQGQMLRAIHETIAPRMASNQLSFRDLGTGNTAAIIPEILARSGLAQAGIAVDKLVMHFGIDGHPPQPLPTPQVKATAPSASPQLNMKVGGINVHAGAGGIDTAGIKDQLVEKAKSTLRWYAFMAVILLIVAGGVAGFGFYIYRSIKNPPPPPAAAAKAAEKAAEKPHPGKK